MERKIRARGLFSERNNIRPLSTAIQYDDLDEMTRINLRNFIINSVIHYYDNDKTHFAQNEFKLVYAKLFVVPVNVNCRIELKKVIEDFDKIIKNSSYDEIYDLIEGFPIFFRVDRSSFESTINKLFKENYVGYRMIDGKITKITSKEEIESIKDVIDEKDIASEHMRKALSFLSDRKHPDYENSIKESILAVEGICQIITGKEKITLGEALTLMESRDLIPHKALSEGFKKLYGYTSDANGIRHIGNIGGPDSTFDEAKYMLVSCSAFINYLRCICLK